MQKTQETNVCVFENAEFDDIIGQEESKHQLRSALISGHHLIIVGPPGIGKTTLARSVAKLLPDIETEEDVKGKKINKTAKGADRFVRVQGSPDLTAEDLLGDIDPIKALKFGPQSIEAFTPGKIFKAHKGVLFFDEVNRCPERLQNSLLQVLQEGTATIGSYTVDFPSDFILIATMNPEDSSTEQLSEVFLDRFDVIYMSYPKTLQIEKDIVLKKGKNLGVDFPHELLEMMITFVRLLRQDKKLEKKPSVRASLSLYERAQANAIIGKRKKVIFEDVKDSILSVLSHRIKLIPSAKYLESPEEHLRQELKKFSEDYERSFEQSDGG